MRLTSLKHAGAAPMEPIRPARSWLTSFAAGVSFALVAPELALAALPAPVNPKSGAPAAGDFLDYFKFSANDAGIALGLLIAVIVFLIAGWATIAKFMQARQGRAEWSEVGVTAAIAAVLLVGVSYLLNQSSLVIGAAAAGD